MYYADTLPTHVIDTDDTGTLYLIPNIPGGWSDRKPYRGHVAALRPMDATTARLMRRHLGCPDVSLIGTAEAAAALGIAPRTIQQHANRLGVGTRMGRDLYFAPDDIAAIRARIGKRGRPATT